MKSYCSLTRTAASRKKYPYGSFNLAAMDPDQKVAAYTGQARSQAIFSQCKESFTAKRDTFSHI